MQQHASTEQPKAMHPPTWTSTQSVGPQGQMGLHQRLRGQTDTRPQLSMIELLLTRADAELG